MSAEQPLTQALARAASRFVGESKVGPRKGSVAAVARAMSERGVEISNNTLSRKLAGEYPLNTDEIGALADVLGVSPDAIWADALRIMRESQPLDPPRVNAAKILAESPDLEAVREQGRRALGGDARSAE